MLCDFLYVLSIWGFYIPDNMITMQISFYSVNSVWRFWKPDIVWWNNSGTSDGQSDCAAENTFWFWSNWIYETFGFENNLYSVVLDDLKASERVRIVLNNGKCSNPIPFFILACICLHIICVSLWVRVYLLLISAGVPIFISDIFSCYCCKSYG